MIDDRSKESVDVSVHRSKFDAEKINRAVERVTEGDTEFMDRAIDLLRDLPFPAFKHKMLEHVMKKTDNSDIHGLFESLDGYIEFRDTYHVRKAIEENCEVCKLEGNMSDKTRERPNFNVRPIRPGESIRDKEAINESEQREDYPEIPPTTRTEYICDRCGKGFLTRDDLVHHKRFEG